MHISSISSYHIISYQHTIHLIFHIFLVFKRVLYTHFIILADDGCNTATESSQTNRLLRVFHSYYFHYSEHPHTLFTCLIPLFIFLITSFRYHITPHLISPSITHIPRLSPISSLTSYYSTQCISTHPNTNTNTRSVTKTCGA